MSKKILIWPDLYKEQGHWLPCVNLAYSLLQAKEADGTTPKYSVSFMGIPDCASIVAPYGADFHQVLESVYPSGYSLENKLEPLDQRWKPHHVLPMCRGEGGMEEIFAEASEWRPDLLISGYFTGLETLILHHKYGIKFATITTYLRHPMETPALHARMKLVYMQRPLSQKIIDLAVGPAKAGMSIDEFVEPFRGRLELVPCPQEFDYPDRDWTNQDSYKDENGATQYLGPRREYVEPMIDRFLLDGSTGTRPPSVFAPPASAKVIFGTSGSQVQDYEERAKEFFKNLIAMMQTQGMEDHFLVLGVGDRLLAQLNRDYGIDVGESTLPSNVGLYSWVSQLDVLGCAEAVFMHGGLATIKESIWEEVPIIVVPHGKDQMDNAIRVRRNKLGVVAKPDGLTPLQLRKLFTEATTSTWVAGGLKKMKAVFQERETTKPSIGLINAVVEAS